MKIPIKIKTFFEQVPVMALATADKSGIPNVSAIASKKIVDDHTIYTIDTFHDKTLKNIKENPNVSIAMWKDSEGYQIKGMAKYHTEGEIFEAGKEWILKLKPQKIVKGVMEIEVNEIYYLTPDYDLAGKIIVKPNLKNKSTKLSTPIDAFLAKDNMMNRSIIALLIGSYLINLYVANWDMLYAFLNVFVQVFSSIMMTIFITQYQIRRGRASSFYKIWRTAFIIITLLSLLIKLLGLIPETIS